MSDTVFAGAVPQLYNQHLGPVLFQPFAEVLAEQLVETGPDILETAAGTGVVTRAIAAKRPDARIVATDLNQAMLDVAAQQSPPGVTWKQADAQALPFGDGTFDATVCGFGMMFMPDRVAAYREALRVLRSGGRFVASVWDRIDTNPLMHLSESAVAQLFPHDPPRFLSRTPCGYADPARIEADLRAAGFTQINVETVARDGQAESVQGPAMGLCQGTPLRGEIEARDMDGLGRATAAAIASLTKQFGSGPIRASQQALVMTAIRP
jgi:ubiquinone/menaquinone biosynthesis C-methylase UbiE